MDHFRRLYYETHANAYDLLTEAEILFDREKFARAYALAFTALKEIAKSQLAADVYTGLVDADEFESQSRNHQWKIHSMGWATEDAKRYLDLDGEIYLNGDHPTMAKRMSALYTDINGTDIQKPTSLFTRENAQFIIHTVRVAMERIMEITEYWGYQIGTKGFMK